MAQIKGVLRASDLLIGDGPNSRSACLRRTSPLSGVKDTIRAVRVKLQNGGSVEGDIFHPVDRRELFIRGSITRVENPTYAPVVDVQRPRWGARPLLPISLSRALGPPG